MGRICAGFEHTSHVPETRRLPRRGGDTAETGPTQTHRPKFSRLQGRTVQRLTISLSSCGHAANKKEFKAISEPPPSPRNFSLRALPCPLLNPAPPHGPTTSLGLGSDKAAVAGLPSTTETASLSSSFMHSLQRECACLLPFCPSFSITMTARAHPKQGQAGWPGVAGCWALSVDAWSSQHPGPRVSPASLHPDHSQHWGTPEAHGWPVFRSHSPGCPAASWVDLTVLGAVPTR